MLLLDDNNEEEGYERIELEKRATGQGVVIIPNPNTGQFVISGLNMEEVTNMTLYDIHGEQIIKNISTLSDEIKFDENIDSGLYIFSIRYSNGEMTNKKIVIVR